MFHRGPFSVRESTGDPTRQDQEGAHEEAGRHGKIKLTASLLLVSIGHQGEPTGAASGFRSARSMGLGSSHWRTTRRKRPEAHVRESFHGWAALNHQRVHWTAGRVQRDP